MPKQVADMLGSASRWMSLLLVLQYVHQSSVIVWKTGALASPSWEMIIGWWGTYLIGKYGREMINAVVSCCPWAKPIPQPGAPGV